MLPNRVSNPGPLTYESGALPIALRGLAALTVNQFVTCQNSKYKRKLKLAVSLTLPRGKQAAKCYDCALSQNKVNQKTSPKDYPANNTDVSESKIMNNLSETMQFISLVE